MVMPKVIRFCVCFLLIGFYGIVLGIAQSPSTYKTDFNALSEELLQKIIQYQETEGIEHLLATTTIDQLAQSLNTNEKRLAFWVNIYNAYIQLILRQEPELYEDRDRFFAMEQIPIAGTTISFETIEHGLIRKSQWEYGMGYIGNWFPSKFEKELRVFKMDYRIHFALNCGAKDCPPVAIYDWRRLDDQFKAGTQRFLKRSSVYSADSGQVLITPIFNWFRGDFGGTQGIKEILHANGIIPDTAKLVLTYSTYDWTLAINNFIDL